MRKRLRERIKNNLPPEVINEVYSSFDIVGDIAIIKAPHNSVDAQVVTGQIMAIHKKVKTIFLQTSSIEGDHRTRQLTLLAGIDRSLTKCKEANCTFLVDVKNCYFSPRLSYEHRRIANLVSAGETVINMFAGVGCFSIIIAHLISQTSVYSIDINPAAYQCMIENIKINEVLGRVHPFLGDSKQIVETQLQSIADRVLMPLPEKALAYLPAALSGLKEAGGWIHYYDFQHAVGQEDPIEKSKAQVAQKLNSLGVAHRFFYSRIVRSTGPNWFQIVLDIKIAPNKL